jgi:glycosyltransferase involved in cell wall biosynthesis
MNIAIVANSSWNIYNFRLSLIRYFQKCGYAVYIFCPDDGYVSQIKEQATAHCIIINNLERKGTNPFKDLQLVAELQKGYRENKIDIALHFTIKPNVYGTIAAKRLGITSIANVTGLGSALLKKGLLASVAKRIFKFALRKSDKIVTQNKNDKKYLEDLNINKPGNIIIINGSGIDSDFYSPGPQMIKKNNNFVFLFIGRFLFDKGIIELIDAFNKVCEERNDAELNLLGEIDRGNPSSVDDATLQEWLKNSSIKNLGHQLDSKQYISNSDCVVLPSYREGLAKSLLEGMSMAKPIIATNVPGCKDLITENNGILCEAKSSESLKSAMLSMLELPEEALNAMGSYGRKMILEKYDENIINKSYGDLISSLTGRTA